MQENIILGNLKMWNSSELSCRHAEINFQIITAQLSSNPDRNFVGICVALPRISGIKANAQCSHSQPSPAQ
jgi:hypothetical protein